MNRICIEGSSLSLLLLVTIEYLSVHIASHHHHRSLLLNGVEQKTTGSPDLWSRKWDEETKRDEKWVGGLKCRLSSKLCEQNVVCLPER